MNTSPLRIVRKQYQTVIRGRIWGAVRISSDAARPPRQNGTDWGLARGEDGEANSRAATWTETGKVIGLQNESSLSDGVR